MNKDFVPNEQALDLKEIEFDEPCFGRFNNEGDLVIAHTEKYIISNGVDRSKFFTLAPLYQQAFRWFREKHKLYHTINMFGDWDKPQYSYLVSGRTMTNPAHMWHYEEENTYEEAELACLKKLIEITKLACLKKLIEIVKKK